MSTTANKIAALQQAQNSMPEYSDIIPFFLELYQSLEKAGDSGITVSKNSKLQAKLSEGFPLLSPTDIIVDEVASRLFLRRVVATFIKSGKEGGEALTSLDNALVNNAFDTAPIFRAILERQRKPIDELAASLNVLPPLVEYLFEIPLKYQLEKFAETISSSDIADWHNGYCPVCGSRAGMAEFVGDEGKRQLSCSTCSFTWGFKRLECPFCGNDNPEKLSYFSAGSTALTRVDTCKSCSRYIKTRDSRKTTDPIPLEIEDILTMHLDMLAAKEGFERGK